MGEPRLVGRQADDLRVYGLRRNFPLHRQERAGHQQCNQTETDGIADSQVLYCAYFFHGQFWSVTVVIRPVIAETQYSRGPCRQERGNIYPFSGRFLP